MLTSNHSLEICLNLFIIETGFSAVIVYYIGERIVIILSNIARALMEKLITCLYIL